MIKDELQELLSLSGESLVNNMYTAIPCIVLGIIDNLQGAMVNIQPTVNQRMKDGTVKQRQPILGVPIVFPCSKTSAFTFPISVGDTGLAVFSMRNLDAWKSGEGFPAAPLNFAKFDKGDAIFIPGLQPQLVSVNNPAARFWSHSTRDTVVAHNIGTANEVEMRMTPEGEFLIRTNAGVQVQAENVAVSTSYLTVEADETDWVGNMTISGTMTISGDVTQTGSLSSNGIVLDAHRHSDVTPGNGTTGGPL